MKIGDYIFVYGTLRPGCGNYERVMARFQPKHVGRGSLQGAHLLDIGGFPGLVMTDVLGDVVQGDVFELNDDNLIRNLDYLEGYPRMYDRRVVTLVDGTEAWVYTWNLDKDRYKVIQSGDWLEHVKARAA